MSDVIRFYVLDDDDLLTENEVDPQHCVAVVLATDYDALLAERDALKADAERYLEWRFQALVFKPIGNAFADAMMAARTPAEIDAAVDAARSPERDGEKP